MYEVIDDPEADKVRGFVVLNNVDDEEQLIEPLFLLVGMFRIVEELIFKACDCQQAMEISYAAVGGLFLLVGALLWSRRTKNEDSE